MPIAQQLPGLKRTASPPSPALLALTVRVHRVALDARLAAGETSGEPALALRAAQLCDRRNRLRIARSLARTVTRAGSAVDPARDPLRQLNVALRSPEAVRAQGVAEVLVLLRDASGPLQAPTADPEALYRAVRTALLDMVGCKPASVELVPGCEDSFTDPAGAHATPAGAFPRYAAANRPGG